MIKVENMTSPRSGRPIANQFVIKTDEGEFFQSYRTVIALKRNDGRVILNTEWNHSVTTRKYRNEFLGEGTQDTRKKVEEGVYKLANLN